MERYRERESEEKGERNGVFFIFLNGSDGYAWFILLFEKRHLELPNIYRMSHSSLNSFGARRPSR